MALREKNMWASQMGELIVAVRLLSRGNGSSIDELSDELGVSRRTIFRLKDSLEQLLGGPLDEIQGLLQKEKRFKFPSGFTLSLPLTSQSGLTTPELMALYALRMNSGLFRGSDISTDIDSAFSKIGKALSPATRALLEKYSTLFISVPKTPKDYSAHAETLEELSMAILARTTCRICYNTFSEDNITEKTYEINPLHFFERDGGLYVFVVVPFFKNIRLLAVERIKQIDPTEKTFEWPEDFDPEALLEKAFGLYWDDPLTAKIKFPAAQGRYIRERKWAVQQQIEELADGSIILTMETSGSFDVKRWVMSFGSDAELLEPQSLRDEIQNEAKKMAATYRRS
ncbi:MAG: WYL domain-containing protein [Chlorobium sp.]|nr:WYL domain-containing protein [Chlorobium sp.]